MNIDANMNNDRYGLAWPGLAVLRVREIVRSE